ncbi:hypothetical protein E3E31_03850 [Thermococcus sp. M39]|nr:hypothetical protein [Thermococcus sp. M39]
MCNNALNIHHIDKANIFEFCEIVPAGITKHIELQKESYVYVKMQCYVLLLILNFYLYFIKFVVYRLQH